MGRLPLLLLALAIGLVTTATGCGGSDEPVAGSPAAGPDAAVRIDGNRLVGSNGKSLRLLGVNRSGAEYACVAPTEHDLGFFDGPTSGRAVAAMVAWGINAVRIPLNESCWLGINGAPGSYSTAEYRNAIARYVAHLHEAGVYVVLDLHWSAPGTERAEEQQPMADRDHSPAFWASVGRAFKGDPAIVFDLYNEPYDVSWQCWRDGCALPAGWTSAGMQTLVDAVRSTGASQPIIATGLEWGNDLSDWLDYRPHDPAGQLAAGLHMYNSSHECTDPDCWTEEIKPVAREVPVVATELGQDECSDDFIERFMDWADSAGISYLGWSWNPSGCGAPSLIKSWGGTPTASGAVFRAHLLGY
jgi:endoglucanase